jgi:hypothetical protein
VHFCKKEEYQCTDEIKNTQHLLGSEEPIGNHSHQEWRNDHGKRKNRVHISYLRAVEANGYKILRELTVPGSPHNELQKHHDG